jgi:uncharacterized protein (TIGR03437 family)
VTITPGQAGANFQVQAGIATSARSVTITATAPTNTIQSSVTVLPGNPPIINAPDQLTTVFSNPVDFTISVSDFYGLPLTLAASSLPQGATFDSTTGRFQWMPSSAQIGTFAVIVTAIDSAGLSASKQVPIRVTSDKPQLLGMYNAASLVPDATCVAGSFATLVGTGFASSGFQQVASRGILPTDLSGVEVSINNVAVPLLFASDTLINFQCPNLPVHSGLTIAIKPASGPAIDPIMARVVEASPAIYTLFGTAQGAVVIAETGQVAMPVRDALPSRPARPGEFVSIYASGIGPLQEVVATGVPAPLDHTIQTTDPVTVVVSGIQVAPAFSGLAPGQVGLYQVNLQLPVKVPTGDAVPISVVVALGDGTVLTSNSVTFAVQAASTTAPTATARDSER